MLDRFARAGVLLFDGTLYTDDEMLRLGASEKTGLRMGHMPIDGADGSLRALSNVKARRIYTHINNTNPIHVAGSLERLAVEAEGWKIAEDGMEIVL
jgi:pyrroloquinoline quinone biosynthesis protein B